MNQVIRKEFAGAILGVEARFFNVVADTETGRILNQTVRATRYYSVDSSEYYQINVEIRFDDSCRNGHESFAITGETRILRRGVYRTDSCGRIHDQIARHFPELAPLIKWHLTSTDGPMHYIANTVYLAGNRDCRGLTRGQPESFEKFVRFGGSRALFRAKDNLAKFLAERKATEDFVVIQIPYTGDSDCKFNPKFTLAGFGGRWHECPFDSRAEAEAFAAAANNEGFEIIAVPTAFSKGKDRELDAARRSAAWPEATAEELMQEPEALKAALAARLPGLIAAFKVDMIGAGLLWPERKEAA